jgi:hypothetical protein
MWGWIVLGVMFAGTSAIGWYLSRHWGRGSQAGDPTLAFAINVPPPIDRSQSVMVTFTELAFYASPGLRIIPGPWIFEIPPDVLRSVGSQAVGNRMR